MADFKVVGKRMPRLDGAAKVTGHAVYADDLVLPGMLHGALLRSPHSHARILSIDTAPARRIPGVRAVITSAECPYLAGTVLYPGQKIAAVAAVDRYVAEAAARAIEVEYEMLPAVYDVMDAIRGDAPEVRPSRSNVYKNICSEQEFDRGDAVSGFSNSDVVVEDEYFVPAAHQAYMEPHCCVTRYGNDNTLHVWTGVQGQFGARSELADIFGLPLRSVEVEAPEIGGAFGGKTGLILEPIAASLSKKAGAPVKMRMSRAEELMDSRPGPACLIRVRTGAMKDGTLVAEEAELFYDTGAAPGAPSGSLNRTRGLYRIPNFHYHVYSVFTNKLVPGPYRAPGALEMTFAFESQIDLIAEQLKLDPIELRIKNAVDDGDIAVDGSVYPSIGLKATLRAARDYGVTIPRRAGSGVGVACGKWMNAIGASSVVIALDEDGGIHITSGAVDLTGVNTVLAQTAAEELGVPFEQVTVSTKGTGTAPYAAVSGGSRTTYGMTMAVKDGVVKLIRAVTEFCSGLWGKPIAEAKYHDGSVSADGQKMSLGELSRAAMASPSGPISVTGSASNETWLTDSNIFITQIAEVSMDEMTGMVRVERISSFQDVGFAMNPTLVEGQIEGGIVQGFGWGMLEGLEYHDGMVLNNSYTEYKVPTSMDAPDAVPFAIEVASPSGPYGIKGVGEPSMVAAPAAIANAMANATGHRVTRVPFIKSQTDDWR